MRKQIRFLAFLLVSLMVVLNCSALAGNSVLEKETEGQLPKEEPMFAWIDDDGKFAVYDKLYSWAVKNQVPFTSAVISGSVDAKGYITSQNIRDMYNSGLVHFANHTANHRVLTNLEIDEIESQIKTAKTYFEMLGVPCDVMVYPSGASNQNVIDITSKHYPLGFAAGGWYTDTCRMNYKASAEIYKLERLSISATADIDFIKQQIDLCCSTGGVLIFMSHIGSTSGATGGASADADLMVYQQAIDYIREKGYDISNLMDACARFVSEADAPSDETDLGTQDFITAEPNTYLGTTPPSGFPENSVVSNYVVGYTEGLPGKFRGVLTTYTLSRGAYQIFAPSSQTDLFIRIRSSNEDKWLGWKNVDDNYVIRLSNDVVHAETLPKEIPDQITVCLIAKQEHLDLLPEKQLGYLTSYRISYSSVNVRQEWQPVNSVVKYVREATTSNEWGPWYKFEPVLVE